MKGYYIDSGYIGYLPSSGTYMKFASESDYKEYFQETEE